MDPVSLVLVGGIMSVGVVGYFRLRAQMAQLREKSDRVSTFRRHLKRYVEAQGEDREAYVQMVHQSLIVQRDLGSFGFMSYKPPGANYVIHNYPLVVNLLSELDQWLAQDAFFSMTQPGRSMAQMLDEALIRFLGVLEDRAAYIGKQWRNPAVLIREGMQAVLVLPAGLLYLLGLGREGLLDRLSQSAPVRVLAGLISVLSVLSAVVSLVVGWSEFVTIIRQLWPF